MCRPLITALLLWVLCGHSFAQAPARSSSIGYQSPYSVRFSEPLSALIGDLESTERGDYRLEAEVPYSDWYSSRTLRKWEAWGPRPRAYPAPVLEGWSPSKRRERVVAVALRFVGYGYQHHHIPDWNPPADWPWKPTRVGHNGKGVDCSNFTAFVYNLGFGLQMSGDIHRQAEERKAHGPGRDRATGIRKISLPATYRERVESLRSGDLVYIANRSETISHVVIWVGPIGRSPDGVPLIIDSHGEGVLDSEGHAIPSGIQLRPFRENSWYNRSASHAHRILDEAG